jgi:hypothetical protein
MEENKSPLSEHFATYKQYKDDTKSIAGWLAKNALRCGYEIPASAALKTSKLKGKARKQAKASVTGGSKYTM